MNENLNLVEILKDCPKGTKLYSTVFGDVELEKISNDENDKYPIFIRLHANTIACVAKDGRYLGNYDGECVLFPSKDRRDWSKFKPKQPKFDPKTLQPYMRVLVRDSYKSQWKCAFYSHERENEKSLFKYTVTGSSLAYVYCIPDNDDTKHLVGTDDEAPEFYRYWED